MKAQTALAIGAVVSLALVSPAFAVQPESPHSSQAAPSPAAKKPSALAVPHHITGNVLSVNRNADMFTVKGSDGTTHTLKADQAVASQLKDLKKGERVKVTYKNSKGEQIATKVTPA